MQIHDLAVVFENDDLFIINKPAGLSFHSENQMPGAAVTTQQLFGQELWPAHRLDKITSGLLMFAKNKPASKSLGQLFEQRLIQKNYIALSASKPKKKQGKIVGDMVKARNGSWKLSMQRNNPTVTIFQSTSLVPGIRFFWVTPQTGKTHQIRVALKSIGAPILGDQRYGNQPADRGYLHAYRLAFNWQGEALSISCLPQQGDYFLLPELQQCIKSLDSA